MLPRGVLFVLALVAVPLAGCLGSLSDRAGPATIPDDAVDGPTADLPVVTDATGDVVAPDAFPGEVPSFDLVKVSDRISGEPTIGVTRDGTVVYPAVDFDAPGDLPRTVYMASTDGGESWEEINPEMAGVETHPTTFDPYVYTDPTTGRIYAMDMGPHVLCNKVSWSDEGGDTWVTRDGACIPGINDHPTLFAGPATATTNTAVYPNQLYLCTNQVTDSICYQSPDGGLTWVATEPPYPGVDKNRMYADPGEPFGAAFSGLCGGLHGHGHASFADGTIYLGRDWCGRPAVAVSHDGGVTWNRNILSADREHDPAGHDISIGTDSEGNAYALWVADSESSGSFSSEGRSVYLSRSFDRGRTWETPINVTAPGVTAAKLPSLVAGSEGRIAFLYVGTENPHGWHVDDLKEGCDDRENRSCLEHPDAYDNATWNAYVGTSLNAETSHPVFATVRANDEDAPLKRGGCSGRCFGDEGGMYDFLDINIHPETGRVWTALVDVCAAECDDASGKFEATEEAVGVAARMMDGTRLLTEPIPER